MVTGPAKARPASIERPIPSLSKEPRAGACPPGAP